MLVTLSGHTPEVAAIFLRFAAGAAILISGVLQWFLPNLTLSLNARYDDSGKWIPPADPQLWALQWSEAVGVILAVVGIVWCLSCFFRWLGRVL